MVFLRKYFLVVWGVFVLSFFCISGLSASAATVTVTKTGTGQGTVVSSDQSACALLCSGSSCTCTAATGSTVQLTEIPNLNNLFGGWSGACSGGNQTCSFTVPAASAVSVEARFQTATQPLSVTKSGGGTGTVTSTPSGINCGSDCAENFDANTNITLIASPSASSSLATWSGVSCQGGNNQTGSCTFTMDGAKTVTAVFVTGHRLTVNKSGEGTVTSSPSGINCGSQCSIFFPGTNPSVTLTATPGSGQRFKEWTNGASSCGTNATCTLTLNEEKAVLATFEAIPADNGTCEDTNEQKCSANCSNESGYEAGGTGTCTDTAKPQCCKKKDICADQGGSCEMTTSCLGTPLGQFNCPSGQTCCKTQEDPSEGARCLGSENAGLVPCGRTCDDPSTGNDETKICTLCHLLILIQNITNWILMVMTYIAFAVLVAMGILYIISTGKPQLTGMAKSGIWAALVGFAIVLLGWVAINVILFVLADGALGTDTANFSIKTNGKWFEYRCDTQTKYTGTSGIGNYGGDTGGGGGTVTCGEGGCAKDEKVKAAVQAQTHMPANDYMAILQAGEHYSEKTTCSNRSSPTGACGVSQTMPPNYTKLCGFSSCEAMRADINKDIACGAKVAAGFKQYHNVSCVDDKSKKIDCTIDGLKSLAGCYNRGFHCNISPRNVSGKWYDCGEIQGGKSYCDRVSEYAGSCK